MKKILLTLVCGAALMVANAQRNVDWKVDAILSPTELNSNANNTTPISVAAVLKNEGTDSVMVGDSIYIQWAVANMSNQAIVLYPGPNLNTYRVILAHKKMMAGDTMIYRFNGSLNLGVYPSINVKIFVTSLIFNRPGMKVESSTSNNSMNTTIVWYNPQKWPLSANSVQNNSFISVYPNPASTVANIDLNVFNSAEPVKVSMIDAMGRMVYNSEVAYTRNIAINTETLAKGVYFIRVENGSLVSNQKLVIE